MLTKETVRKNLLSLREAQSPLDKHAKDIRIARHLETLDLFTRAVEFFTYIPHRAEVDTLNLITRYFGQKKILVPKVEDTEICLYELRSPHDFEKGRFGVREPTHCVPHIEFASIDLALIPGVAFDLRGHRVGYGGGYFDRLLKKIHCTTIGLAYEFQIVDKLPAESYDVAVDWVVTEERIIKCTD